MKRSTCYIALSSTLCAALLVACGSGRESTATGPTGVGSTGAETTTSGASSSAGMGGSMGPSGSSSSAMGGAPSASSSSSAAGGSGGGGNSKTVRLIAIGDTGEGNVDQHCLADAMNAKCGQDGCDAVLLAGDNFYDDGVTGTDDPLWVKAFEEPYDRPELNKIPFYAVLGNHDYSPTILKQIVDSKGVKQAQIDYSYLPVGQGANTRKTDKWTMPAPYYDVQFGEGLVHVFGMDSVDAGEFSGAAQLNDMKQRVNASTAKWKLVFAHHPRFTSGDHQKDNDLLNTVTALFAPSMYELQQGIYCNADLFLSGHDHDREFLDKGQDPMCPNTHFMVSGAGAKVNSKKGSNLAKQLYYNNAIEGFFYLIFSDNELRIESYDMDPQACAAAGLAAPAWSNAPITKP